MKNFQKKLQAQFDLMCQGGVLFTSTSSGQELWDAYLAAFENKDVFRDPESSVHNCNNCNNFMRRYGNILGVVEGKLVSIWDAEGVDIEYQPSANAAKQLLEASTISNIFVETYAELNGLPYERTNKRQSKFLLGVDRNRETYSVEDIKKHDPELKGSVKPGEVYTFDHLHLHIPKDFIHMGSESAAKMQGIYKSKFDVFERCMREIAPETFTLMKDLIVQGSILNSNQHIKSLESYLEYKKQYDLATDKTLYCWQQSHGMSEAFAKFGNSLQGTFLKEVSEGKSLQKACEDYNKRVDPLNYMKAKAPITEAQRKIAEQFVVKNGYLESFNRRLMTLEDVKASEILHINRGDKAKEVTIFGSIPTANKSRHKRSEFDKVEVVSIKTFMSDILPSASAIEVLLENKHEGNLVNLTTTITPEAKPLFKWENPFGYTFNGGLAGKSNIKEVVKSKGGKVDGVLRFSIMWAEGDEDNSDLDAHCMEPNDNLIYYGNSSNHRTSGKLDIDITNPRAQMPTGAVENIVYSDSSKMLEGTYEFKVHQFSARRSAGFKAEIEFNGEIYSYEYTNPVRGKVSVAKVTLKNGEFSIEHSLPETNSSCDIWGLPTGEFHKVRLVSTTPNHWGENKVGNNHYLFMLTGAKNPNPVRGFHNEHLNSELLGVRKVLDVLGDSAMIQPTDNQLAGVGFNETVRDEVVVRVSGSFKRVIKVQF